jgi:hypothetical protein
VWKFLAAILTAAMLTLSMPISSADVGDSAGDPVGRETQRTSRGAAERAAQIPNVSVQPRLFQNKLWWFGAPNPTPPAPLYTRTFTPLANLPGWSQQSYGWFRNLNFETCVGGLTNVIGPYGTSTNSVTRGCK